MKKSKGKLMIRTVTSFGRKFYEVDYKTSDRWSTNIRAFKVTDDKKDAQKCLKKLNKLKNKKDLSNPTLRVKC